MFDVNRKHLLLPLLLYKMYRYSWIKKKIIKRRGAISLQQNIYDDKILTNLEMLYKVLPRSLGFIQKTTHFHRELIDKIINKLYLQVV